MVLRFTLRWVWVSLVVLLSGGFAKYCLLAADYVLIVLWLVFLFILICGLLVCCYLLLTDVAYGWVLMCLYGLLWLVFAFLVV